MIGFFPDLYPGELLYSALARYRRRVGFGGQRRDALDLFGDRNVVPSIDLPGRLDDLVSSLPAGHRYTVEGLIACHTLAPIFTTFRSREQNHALVVAMKSSNVSARARSGLAASLIPTPRKLRYCPKCFLAQLHSGSEPYWLRLHQVPWVEVCPEHGILLESAFDRGGGRLNRFKYFDASELTTHLVFRECIDAVSLAVATSTAELLDRGLRAIDLSRVKDRYLTLWEETGVFPGAHGFAEHAWKLLSIRMASMLRRLNLDSPSPLPWFLKFLRKPEDCRSSWQHLFILHTLGKSLADLEDPNLRSQAKAVSCPNRTCNSPVPSEIRRHPTLRKRKIIVCEVCGYTCMDGSKRRVLKHGPVWEKQLQLLWNSDLSTRAIASRLGCDSLTATRHAHRLGLPFPRVVDGRVTTLRKPFTSQDRTVTRLEISARRARWTLKASTARNRKAAQRLVPADYAWLRRNDLSWLAKNLPTKQPPHGAVVQGELWAQRENELLMALDSAVQNIRAKGESLSVAAVARQLSASHLIPGKLKSMPRLAESIAARLKSSRTNSDHLALQTTMPIMSA